MSGDRLRELWASVIERAVFDASSELVRSRQLKSRALPSYKQQREARNWLTGDSEDFRTVCDLANFDPARVRDTALQMRRRGWK